MKTDPALLLIAQAAQLLLAVTAIWAGWSALSGRAWGLALLGACIVGLLLERWPAVRDRSPHTRSQPHRERRADFAGSAELLR